MNSYSVGALSVIFQPGWGFLLVQPNYRPGRWQLPGGFLEDGEAPEEALRRELLEELAVHIEVSRFLGTYLKVEAKNISLVYRCSIASGRLQPDGVEIGQYGFFHSDHLPNGVSPGTFQILRSQTEDANFPFSISIRETRT